MDNNELANMALNEQMQQQLLREAQEYAADMERKEAEQAQAAQLCCPHCGAAIDEDMDYCENCHQYIRADVCAFCGNTMNLDEAFCSECGSSRDGMACPVCGTNNKFAFCRNCGAPVTEEAQQLYAEVCEMPEYKEMLRISNEIKEIDNSNLYETKQDEELQQANDKLRCRVLELLMADNGVHNAKVTPTQPNRMTTDQAKEKKASLKEQLAAALEKLSMKPQVSPVKARNFAMATKPQGHVLAWRCNWKNAMHGSPCGCGKPQLGGTWVILKGK